MYKKPNITNGRILINKSVEGEPIEQKIERIVSEKSPIKDGAPIIYTERKEGVRASHNIRTDRFEIAIEAMDKVAKSYKARREEAIKNREPVKKEENITGGEPIQGKSQGDTSK